MISASLSCVLFLLNCMAVVTLAGYISPEDKEAFKQKTIDACKHAPGFKEEELTAERVDYVADELQNLCPTPCQKEECTQDEVERWVKVAHKANSSPKAILKLQGRPFKSGLKVCKEEFNACWSYFRSRAKVVAFLLCKVTFVPTTDDKLSIMIKDALLKYP